MTLQPATTSPAPPALGGVHHIAQVTSCPEETLRFYRDALGFPLLHTVSATGWLSNDYPDFIHFFFGLGKGCHLAFFYFFSDPDDKPPSALIRQSKHIAFAVDTEEELCNWRERLKSHGIQVPRHSRMSSWSQSTSKTRMESSSRSRGLSGRSPTSTLVMRS